MRDILGLGFVNGFLRKQGALPWLRHAGMSDGDMLLHLHNKRLIRLPQVDWPKPMAGGAATANSTNDTRGIYTTGDRAAGGWLTGWQAAMQADVTITPAKTFVTGTSVVTSGGGRFIVMGQAGINSVAVTKTSLFTVRLTDGTTEFSNSDVTFSGAATGEAASEFAIPVMGMINETGLITGVTFTLAAEASDITDAPVIKTSSAGTGAAAKSLTQIICIRTDNSGPAGA